MSCPTLLAKREFHKARAGEPTIRTFIRAAGLVSLLMGTVITVEVTVFAILGSPEFVLMVPILLAAVWCIAAVLCFLTLVPAHLWRLARHRIDRARALQLNPSGVWDDWLDGRPRGMGKL
jgi:hypothetical protein